MQALVRPGRLEAAQRTHPLFHCLRYVLARFRRAANKSAALPAALPSDKQSKLDKMSGAKDFDKTFIDEVGVDAHKTDISLFEKASKDADDADLKAFATKTLPTLQAHREHADGLKKGRK